MRVVVADHVTRCDVGHVRDETSGIGLGLSRHRDRLRTEHGTSHNSIPHSRPCLKAWEDWSVPVPRHLGPRIKGNMDEGLTRIVICLVWWNSWQP